MTEPIDPYSVIDRYARAKQLVGSSVTVKKEGFIPHDKDILVLVREVKQVVDALHAIGWAADGSEVPIEDFVSLSCPGREENFIITAKEKFYKRFRVASDVCRHLNLIKKVDRIIVFQAVLYGTHPKDISHATLELANIRDEEL
jgi:hypothetical protein